MRHCVSVLEQQGDRSAKDSEASGEYYHAMAIDLMSEEMTNWVLETEVRLILGKESYVLWVDIAQLPNSLIRIPLSELQERRLRTSIS